MQTPSSNDKIIATAFKWSVLVILLMTTIIALLLGWQTKIPTKSEPIVQTVPDLPDIRTMTEQKPPKVIFTNITQQAGIDFIHQNGATGQRFLPETMGSGAAFFDYDNDGDQDLLLINSQYWETPKDQAQATMALYNNNGQGQFTNVTVSVGLEQSFYGMGVAVGDYNGDGWVDVFITTVGQNHLFQNQQGQFVDVTQSAGLADKPQWSSSSGFFDYDQDGDLDLFIANYIQWSKQLDIDVNYQLTGIGKAYGPPTSYQGTQNQLYRNNGDGSFTDVSQQVGLEVSHPTTHQPIGKALAVNFVDTDQDGDLDIFVANDTVQNFLFENQIASSGRFEEIGMMSGLAFDRNGQATGAMGADFAYYRNNQALALAIGNFANEMTALYLAEDTNQFSDVAMVDGIGPESRLKLSFGLVFLDYDLDGRLDLLQANGHLENEINTIQPSQHYQQTPQLFWNCGKDCRTQFIAVKAQQNNNDLFQAIVGRGLTYADIDNDGDLDILITQNGGRPLLLRNDQQLNHHWLRLKLKGKGNNQNAIGATVQLSVDGIIQTRQVMPTRSYLSQVELPLSFGLGSHSQVEWLNIQWPNGQQQRMTHPNIDQLLVINQE